MEVEEWEKFQTEVVLQAQTPSFSLGCKLLLLFRFSGTRREQKNASEKWPLSSPIYCRVQGTVKYQPLSIWAQTKAACAVLHQNECGLQFPGGKQHNEESGGLMIFVNNSPCGPFGCEFPERERAWERDKERERERWQWSIFNIIRQRCFSY